MEGLIVEFEVFGDDDKEPRENLGGILVRYI